MVKTARKTFTLKDLIHHEKYQYKNLIEMMTEYPNIGVGFRIAKVHWPENYYIKVLKVDLETNRQGKVFGKVYKDGVLASHRLVEVDQTSMRGLWRYDLGDSIAYLGEGFIYDLEDLKKHFNTVRQVGWKRPSDLRKNMKFEIPEGASDPVPNKNVIKRG